MLPPCSTPVTGTTVTLRQIATLDDAALLATSPPNDPRLFVVERAGRIEILEDGAPRATPFIDLEDVLVSGGEQGLLGLAFHPQYATNGRFFVFYTTADANIAAECHVSAADPNVADPTCTPILTIPDFASNHNAGMMEFGSDGYLWITTGDGGGGGDPERNAQDLDSLLGKMLRIDVDGGSPYGIPADNPYAAGGGAPEIYMRGMRNPWRWSFDRMTHDLWIGDVGQDQTEELDVLRPAQQKGANLGWSIYEGDDCYNGGNGSPCEPAGLVFPKDTRAHADGWYSIIGGEVYRGTCYPDLVGSYFYTDNNSATVGLFKAVLQADDSLAIEQLATQLPGNTASIHGDARGELYLTTVDGGVYEVGVAP
jgi:glucose/arabinose dehydrogenase